MKNFKNILVELKNKLNREQFNYLNEKNNFQEKIKENFKAKSKDLHFRNNFSLEPKSGLLNDPNGLVFFNDFYYIFFQNSPHINKHDLKVWSLYKTKDFLNYTYEGQKISPSIEKDADGIYSGGSIVENDELYLFYTGIEKKYFRKINIEKIKNFFSLADFILESNMHKTLKEIYLESLISKIIKFIENLEESNIFLAKRNTSENFDKTFLFKRDRNLYTRHFRDPLALKKDNNFYLLIGAQLKETLKGVISVYKSKKVDKDYRLIGNIKFKNFSIESYMLECPEFLRINNKDIIIFSTQGKSYFNFRKNNESIHNAIYLVGKMNWNTLEFDVEFQDFLDYGFDFYAPQVFKNVDENILIGWNGRPDISFHDENLGWSFNLSIPRKLYLKNNELIQEPIFQLENEVLNVESNKISKKQNGLYEIRFEKEKNFSEISIFNEKHNISIKLDWDNLFINVNRTNMEVNYGENIGTNWVRKMPKKYSKMNLIVDNSLIHFYFDEGKFHFTFYYFIKKSNIKFKNFSNITFRQIKSLKIKDKSKKVLLIGEALIDTYKQNFEISRQVGGAPLNVSLALSKKGVQNSFFGVIGKDEDASLILEYFKRNNLDTSLLKIDPKLKTTVANVSINDEGERNFTFVRGADENLNFEYDALINQYDLVCFSSATAFLGGKLYKSYIKALNLSLDANIDVVFDPNYRDSLYSKNIEDFKQKAKYFITKSNVVKMSLEELEIIYKLKWNSKNDTETLHKEMKKIIENDQQFFLITLGKDGTLFIDKNKIKIIPSIKVKQVDTTGAGDVFLGSFISKYINRNNKDSNSKDFHNEIFEIIKYANVNGALATTIIGVENALKTEEEINELI
ncbi:PfkB family carbohydrate kinase [[Mycoplasma] mobile]|uniref:beta-fructofuranosidase n=1 Tax=Mycoplasma mobile (strain ATCC 43663 / 163K / NCTC 11711) TaxID=267748 RepID=Q6KHH9_MYCM1|nr:PfkB family carbohydrate kinase [[Mycoplasma] mobile]AAT27951.1 sucrose-6-phosphate hydrolase [Mycoplasma mobile 163K]